MRWLMMMGLLVSLVGFVGCSEQTQKEAGEAAQATGEAVESAVDDAAANTEAAAEAVQDAIKDDGTEQ